MSNANSGFGQEFSYDQWERLKRDFQKVEAIQQIITFTLDSLPMVDLEVVALFSNTLAEADDLMFKQTPFLTKGEQQQLKGITEQYLSILQETLRLYHSRVLGELDFQLARLDLLDPQWKLLLPPWLNI